MDQDQTRPTWCTAVLLLGAMVFVLVGVLSLAWEMSAAVSTTVFVLAAGLLVIAVFEGRAIGGLELGPGGAKINLAAAGRIKAVEQQLQLELISRDQSGTQRLATEPPAEFAAPPAQDAEGGEVAEPTETARTGEGPRLQIMFSPQAKEDLSRLTEDEVSLLRSKLTDLETSDSKGSNTLQPIRGFPGWFVMKAGRLRALLQPVGTGVVVAGIFSREDFYDRVAGRT